MPCTQPQHRWRCTKNVGRGVHGGRAGGLAGEPTKSTPLSSRSRVGQVNGEADDDKRRFGLRLEVRLSLRLCCNRVEAWQPWVPCCCDQAMTPAPQMRFRASPRLHPRGGGVQAVRTGKLGVLHVATRVFKPGVLQYSYIHTCSPMFMQCQTARHC